MRFALLPIRAFASILFLAIFLGFAMPALAAGCPLCDAAKKGDVDEVRRLLDGGANPDRSQPLSPDFPMPETALLHAIREEHIEIVKILLEYGANPNWLKPCPACYSKLEPLIGVAQYEEKGKEKIVAMILILGGFTPLIKASAHGKFEIAKILLEGRANPNQANKEGFTPLIVAAMRNKPNTAVLLLDNGADPNLTYEGETALDIAQRKENSVANAIQNWQDEQFRERRKAILAQKNREKPKESESNVAVAAPPKSTGEAETVFENAWRSIVFIEVSSGQGSGVIVKPNLVATNCHVIEGGDIVVYKSDNRRTDKKTKFYAQLGQADYRNDLCLLDVAGLWGIPASVRKYDTLRVGEKVYALGSPFGLDLTYTDGVVSQLRKIDDKTVIQTNAAISPGSSGGGLFDSEANLIGITTFGFDKAETEGLNFAIPADLVIQY